MKAIRIAGYQDFRELALRPFDFAQGRLCSGQGWGLNKNPG